MELEKELLPYIYQETIFSWQEPVSAPLDDKYNGLQEEISTVEETKEEPLQKEVEIPTQKVEAPTEPEIARQVTPQVNKPQESPANEREEIKFWGQNLQKTLLLVNDSTAEFLNDNDLALLKNIITGGLKLQPDDVALVNTSRYEYTKIMAEIPWNSMIIFDPKILVDLAAEPGEIKYIDGKPVIFSHPVAALHDNKEKKEPLWKGILKVYR